MSRVLQVILSAVLLMTLFAGCSDKSDGGSDTVPTEVVDDNGTDDGSDDETQDGDDNNETDNNETGPEVSALLNPIYYSNTAVLEGSIDLGNSTASASRSIQSTSANYGTLYLVGDSVISTLASGGISSLEAIPAPFSFTQVEIADDGSYRIEDLPAGTNYQLIYIDGTDGANLGEITLKAGTATTQNITSVSANIPAIPAYIKDLSGALLEGATLKIHQTGQVLTADATGLVTLANLPVGSYTFTVSAEGYVSKVFSIDLTASLTSLETIELNDQKGAVTGTATIDGNENHANIVVYAKAADGSVYTALTDESGSYTFPALPVDEGYSVIATANGLQSAKVKDVTVTADETTSVTSMTLSVLNTTTDGTLGSIVGFARFYGVSDMNHAGILVSIEDTDFEAVTSRDGSFILNNISEGSYTLNFTDSNHITQTYEVEVVAGAATKLTDVTLHKPDEPLTLDSILDGNTDISNITQDLTLPTTLSNGATVVWSSSAPSLISNTGVVTIPSYNTQNTTVVLTATVTLNSITTSQNFTFAVLPDYQPVIQAIADIGTSANPLYEDFSSFEVEVNASNASGDPITYSLSSSNGSLFSSVSIDTNGTITFVPGTNSFGSTTITVTATSGGVVDGYPALSTTESFVVTVEAVNDAPVATFSAFTAFNKNPTEVVLTGIDTETPVTDLTYTISTQPSHGVISLEGNGSMSYTPTVHYSGSDTFGYKVFDGGLYSTEKTVTVTVKKTWVSLCAANQQTVAIADDGTVWGAGSNGNNVLGLDTSILSTNVFVQLDTANDWNQTACGSYFTLFLNTSGNIYGTGSGMYGEMGDGKLTAYTTVTEVNSSIWESIDAFSSVGGGIKNGELWLWGSLTNGFSYDAATRIGTDSNWSSLAIGYDHIAAIKDGTLWTWGSNDYGQLGDGTTTINNTPTQKGSDNDWATVVSGYRYSCALKSDGTLWAWGFGGEAVMNPVSPVATNECGSETALCKKSPTQIGTDSDWVKIAVKSGHILALKSDGTIWSWGDNGYGQLADPLLPSYGYSTPVQIGDDSDWVDVGVGNSHSMAIKADGTMWTWGANDKGQLGLGDVVGTSSYIPIMVTDY